MSAMVLSRLILVFFCLSGHLLLSDGRAPAKGAKISLRAKWPATPILHEAAEFLVR